MKRLFDALQQAGNRQYKAQLGYLYALLQSTPRFRSTLDFLKARAGDFDADDWTQTKVLGAKPACHAWPPSEDHKLIVLLRIMQVCATDEKCNPTTVGRILTYGTNLDAWAQAVTTHIVFPLVDYLQTRLGTESETLYQLERMRRRVEWFEQDRLYQAFNADTKRGEALYDREVREFLFDEGIDYPFSQPASASGRADVVAALEGDDPLVCEIKLYDGNSYGTAYLRQGVGQAVRYAHDYSKPAAFLVVFNLSDERLQFPSDATNQEQPPRLQIEGVTVFLVVVQAKPIPPASKDRRQVREVPRDDLVQRTL